MDEVQINRFRRGRLFSIGTISQMSDESVRDIRNRAAAAGEQIDQGIKMVKSISLTILETGLRLPGLLMLELLWRYQDAPFRKMSDQLMKQSPFSYLDAATFLQFIHRLKLDHVSALLYSYLIIFASLLFLTFPLNRLIRMYSHIMSLVIFGFSYILSTIYVEAQKNSKEEVVELNSLVKLQGHGFHFLSQVFFAVMQSFLLELDDEPYRGFLPMFVIPVFVRMCGQDVEMTQRAHNFSCGIMMMFICYYIIYRVPKLEKAARIAFRQIKAIYMIRGIAMGSVTVWKRLRIAELMTFTWLTLFSLCLYVEIYEKGSNWSEAGKILLTGVAETTNTPISLLALALTVSFICKWIADGVQYLIGGTRDHGHVLAHAGYTEAIVLVCLCFRTGFVGMQTEQKKNLLCLVLFTVMSALLQSLLELLEPELINLASDQRSTRSRHIRCLGLATILIIVPLFLTHIMTVLLPLDLWSVIMLANCVTAAIHSLAATLRYFIGIFDSRMVEPHEGSESMTFYVDISTQILELAIAKGVLVFGCIYLTNVGPNLMALVVLLFHVIINLYRRVGKLINLVKKRFAAVKNINKLPMASAEQLKEKSDTCAICLAEMKEEARITPCNHYYHGPCLRKWLAVKMVCPLCNTEITDIDADLTDPNTEEAVQQNEFVDGVAANEPNQGIRELIAGLPEDIRIHFERDDLMNVLNENGPRRRRHRNEQRLHEARDMWPLIVNNIRYDSDSESSSGTEYTIDSHHEDDD